MTDNALLAAVAWVRDLLTGAIGTTVAILAVAAIGLLMLRGRVPVRRGMGVVLGCFVLFSAGTIAEGVATGLQSDRVLVAPPIASPSYTPTVPKPVPYDPYAGAAVPTTQSGQPGGLIR